MAKSGKRKGTSLAESGGVPVNRILDYVFTKSVIPTSVEIIPGKCPDVIYPPSAFEPVATKGGVLKKTPSVFGRD